MKKNHSKESEDLKYRSDNFESPLIKLSEEYYLAKEYLSNHRGLESKVTEIIFLISFVFGIVFISPKFTGNSILAISKDVSSYFGIFFLILGAILIFFYFRKKII